MDQRTDLPNSTEQDDVIISTTATPLNSNSMRNDDEENTTVKNSKVTHYGSYRQGNYMNTTPPPVGGGRSYRVWARSDAISQTTYALDVGARILTFYEEYFGYQFMLPKQDTIAVPDYLGSMENWGLIIQREEAMAYVPLETAEDFKEFVTMVISHELSHVWFGNLVTPIWWDELWLNEGFANYIANVGINFIETSWMALDKFVVNSVQRALEVDGLISSHPVYIPLSNPDEISQIFDTISYEKGGSILRMLQFFLGDEIFQKGLQQSIKDGKPLDVKRIMDTWTLQMNYPTVFMERKGQGIRLSQSRYLLDKTATDPGTYTSPYGYKWEIPFTYTTQKSKDFNQNEADIIWMGKDEADVVLE
ncbi:glutamyl aminopeptidase-like [Mytilus californianus]|uniref:glutamyl aminopeptidase-like n=1 Tax=Mytilus californianus TaxID=6549 RepID=UPI00224622B9|nr:glutamyl aminopeptidase-like [Mytilus californianus]